MPGGYDFGGDSPLLPDNGVVDGSGMLMQDPQLRDALARMLQAQQSLPPGAGQPPQGAPQMPGMNLDQSPGSGNRPYPDMSPASDPAMQQPVPGQRPYPDMGGEQQPPFPASPDPRYTPEVEDRFQKFIGRGSALQPQGDSAFKLPGKMARLNPLDEVDPRDIVGRGSAGTA
jgi:hypothetical protein